MQRLELLASAVRRPALVSMCLIGLSLLAAGCGGSSDAASAASAPVGTAPSSSPAPSASPGAAPSASPSPSSSPSPGASTSPSPSPSAPSVGSAATVPAKSLAPWPVFQRVDALSFASRAGMDTVWGDYWERSEEPFGINYFGHTQELGSAASGNHAVYADLDLGSGVESIMLRVSLPAGSNGAEIRLGSVSGQLLGSCTINSTGGATQYRTVGCPVDPALAKGKQSLAIRFTGNNTAMRFNWFAFWAKDTTQEIDKIQKVQSTTMANRPAPTLPMAGAAVSNRNQLPSAADKLARSYGLWSPGKSWECPKWLHDTYWTKGDDGKVYPTWHPPVDFNPDTGTYCTYGHSHGDDPRGSEVFDIAGMPPFGYVNENHSPADPTNQRNEDHYGHKVLVANNWLMYEAGGGGTKSCDVMFKMHMGTHSPDALVNTAHEMFMAGRCEGLAAFNTKTFMLFGSPGSFKEAEAPQCSQPVDPGFAANPPGQINGGIHRAIPTRDCFLRGSAEDQVAAVGSRSTEFWLAGNHYFTVNDPARYYDPASANKISRTADLCFDATHPLAATLACQEMTASGSRSSWDDPRSLFRGAVQTNTHFSTVHFADAPAAVMYSDAYGRTWQTTPDASRGVTLKQLLPIKGYHYKVDSQASVFPTVDYSAGGKNGVRAPN